MSTSSLSVLAAALESLPNPRSKQGISHPYYGMLALVLLGLLTRIPYVAEIRRWAKTLALPREPLKFKRKKASRRHLHLPRPRQDDRCRPAKRPHRISEIHSCR